MNSFDFTHPRDQIVDIMKRIYGYGMTTTSGGNLSIMDANGDMWISPGSVDKGTLRREDIICVKADGTIEGLLGGMNPINEEQVADLVKAFKLLP